MAYQFGWDWQLASEENKTLSSIPWTAFRIYLTIFDVKEYFNVNLL